MPFVTLDTLLTTLDAAIELAALVLDLLDTLKTLLGIATSISKILYSRPWQRQLQSLQVLGGWLYYIDFEFNPSCHPQSLYRSPRLAARPTSS
jgi:hypothetical protein